MVGLLLDEISVSIVGLLCQLAAMHESNMFELPVRGGVSF